LVFIDALRGLSRSPGASAEFTGIIGSANESTSTKGLTMTDVLALCRTLPEIRVARGASLIEEAVRTDRLFVLRSGAFEVVRNGVRVVVIDEPGAFLGEMSAVLGSAPTANVVATQDSTVHVIDKASTAVRSQPELTYAIAQLLARRLSAVTAYLVDIKRQYAGSDTHLALMDQVLGSLIAVNPSAVKPGSERSDVPDY
jgi:CRP-like cAMP-binding protein